MWSSSFTPTYKGKPIFWGPPLIFYKKESLTHLVMPRALYSPKNISGPAIFVDDNQLQERLGINLRGVDTSWV